MERFNRSFREEVLEAYRFTRIREAQTMAHAWMWIYNNERPQSELGYKLPLSFMDERLKAGGFPTFICKQEGQWKQLVITVTN